MPFILPVKRSSLSKSTRFSKFKDIDETPFFILQERKKHSVNASAAAAAASGHGHGHGSGYGHGYGYGSGSSYALAVDAAAAAKEMKRKPNYRIITKNVYPYYELAYANDIEEIRSKEWKYCTQKIPQLMPPHLNSKSRLSWLLAHFTQLALENEGSNMGVDAEHEVDDEEEDDDAIQQGVGVGVGVSVPMSPTHNGKIAHNNSPPSFQNNAANLDKISNVSNLMNQTPANDRVGNSSTSGPHTSQSATLSSNALPASPNVKSANATVGQAFSYHSLARELSSDEDNDEHPANEKFILPSTAAQSGHGTLIPQSSSSNALSAATTSSASSSTLLASASTATPSSSSLASSPATSSSLASAPPVLPASSAAPAANGAHIPPRPNKFRSTDWNEDSALAAMNQMDSKAEIDSSNNPPKKSPSQHTTATAAPPASQHAHAHTHTHNPPVTAVHQRSASHANVNAVIPKETNMTHDDLIPLPRTRSSSASSAPAEAGELSTRLPGATTTQHAAAQFLSASLPAALPVSSSHSGSGSSSLPNTPSNTAQKRRQTGSRHSVRPKSITPASQTQPLFYPVPIIHSQLPTVNRSDLIPVHGIGAYAFFVGLLSLFALLIRDASLSSFFIYLGLMYVWIFFLVVRLEPFAVSILIEGKGVAQLSGDRDAVTGISLSSHKAKSTKINPKNLLPVNLEPVEDHLPLPRPPILTMQINAGLQQQQHAPSHVHHPYHSHSQPQSTANGLNVANKAMEHLSLPQSNKNGKQENLSKQRKLLSATSSAESRNTSLPVKKQSDDRVEDEGKPVDGIESKELINANDSQEVRSDEEAEDPADSLYDPLVSPTSAQYALTSPVAALSAASTLPPAVLPSVSASVSASSASFSSADSGDVLLPMGCTLQYTPTLEVGKWGDVDGQLFSVRVGPNYKKNKQKAPSGPAMMRCIAADVFSSPGKMLDTAKKFKLPKIRVLDENGQVSEVLNNDGPSLEHSFSPVRLEDLVIDDEPGLGGVPPLWIISWQLPTYTASYFANQEDGDNICFVSYFILTDDARQALKTDSTASAKLLKLFVENIHDVRWHNRFKCIPRVTNADETSLPSTLKRLLKGYYAKPFLTGPHSHYFTKGPGYMQVDVDVHRFCYPARKAVVGFLDDVKSMEIEFGFTVEGVTDEELPEQIMATMKINRVNTPAAKPLSYWVDKISKQK